MRTIGALVLLLVGAVPVFADPIGCPIGGPFTVSPESADAQGNSASSAGGCLPKEGIAELQQFYLGTNTSPGTLMLDFATSFTDVAGDDFGLLTGSYWGTRGGFSADPIL